VFEKFASVAPRLKCIGIKYLTEALWALAIKCDEVMAIKKRNDFKCMHVALQKSFLFK
jgi:hypothetical protein